MEVDLEFALYDISNTCFHATLEQAFRADRFTTAILPETPGAQDELSPFTGQCAVADLSRNAVPEVSVEEIDHLLDQLQMMSTKFSKRYGCEVPVPPRVLLRLQERVFSSNALAKLLKSFILLGIDAGTSDVRKNDALIVQAGRSRVFLLANVMLPEIDDGILYDLYAPPLLVRSGTKFLPARAILVPR
ncbi:MAG: hypothetical protein K2W95_19110 [Candidatus Obscuribacterales bacterium]|nr:hypothetical protein [Candidatus Obscuribacterales bacterium]